MGRIRPIKADPQGNYAKKLSDYATIHEAIQLSTNAAAPAIAGSKFAVVSAVVALLISFAALAMAVFAR